MCPPLVCALGRPQAGVLRTPIMFPLTSKKRRLIQPMEVVHRTRAKR